MSRYSDKKPASKRSDGDKHFLEFLPTRRRQKINWQRYGTKLRHCHQLTSVFCATVFNSASVSLLWITDILVPSMTFEI